MKTPIVLALSILSGGALSCASAGPTPGPGPGNCQASGSLDPSAASVPLTERAYVVSRDSGDVTVIDLQNLKVLGNLETCGRGNHMAELSADFTKVYVDSPQTSESIVVDTSTLQVQKRIALAEEPTHASLSRDGRLLAIVNETSNSVSFVDTATDTEVRRVPGFYLPHFVRWAPDGQYAYVANLGAYHVTRVKLADFSIDGEIPLDGFPPPPAGPTLPEGDGFADVQIDSDGILYAAHGKTGRVLVYDTNTRSKVRELAVGQRPWIVYAQHPFTKVLHHLVPNFGDRTVSVIARGPLSALSVSATVGGADQESFGVNYTPLAPERAYVMNRYKNEIAVVNTLTNERMDSIPVGGTTETASTTADGKYVVAAVSSANRVVVLDAMTGAIVKTFDGVGKYPWSVTIPLGQNYCH